MKRRTKKGSNVELCGRGGEWKQAIAKWNVN